MGYPGSNCAVAPPCRRIDMFRFFLLIIVLFPISMGGVYPWSWAVFGLSICACLGIWAGRALSGKTAVFAPPSGTYYISVPFFLAILWAAFQTLPFAPAQWRHPLWRTSLEFFNEPIVGSISLNPAESGMGILRLLIYGGVFWLALQLCRNPKRALAALQALAFSGAVFALYGLVVWFSGNEYVLWFKKTAYGKDLTSVLINRNSYATFAGLGLVCMSALLLQQIKHMLSNGASAREKIERFVEKMVGRFGVLLFLWISTFSALLLTHSRAGILSTIVALLVLFLALGISRYYPRRYIALILAPLAAVGVLFISLSGGNTWERIGAADKDFPARLQLYDHTWNAIMDAPLLGTGLETFESVFLLYRPEELPGNYTMAHNSYLENMLELGIPAAFLLFSSVIGMAVLSIMGIATRRRNVIFPAVGVSVTVLIGLHSLLDFSMQIPAIAVTYFAIMGLACAQSWSSRDS